MLPNESPAAVFVRTGEHSAVTIAPNAGFEARWAAWPIGGVASTVATAVAIGYALLHP